MNVEVRAELMERALANLCVDASPSVQVSMKDTLKSLAVILLLEWLVGDKRFESQSQESEYWLSRFYEEVFIGRAA